MDTNKKTIIVGVVITSAIVLFSWRFHKAYKDVKQREEENKELLLDAELEEVGELIDPKDVRLRDLSRIHGVEAVVEAREIQEGLEAKKRMREYIRETQITILEEEEENGVDIIEEDYMDNQEEEEVEKLRHHPDSISAWNQYVSMKLADIDNEEILELYRILFNVEYYPIDDGRDVVIESNLINSRTLFFGSNSKYSNSMTVAELLLHYAELLDFDLDGGVEFWAERLLLNLDFEPGRPLPYTKLNDTVNKVVVHEWYNINMGFSFGIFALSSDAFEPGSFEGMSFMMQYWAFIEDEAQV